MTTFQIRGTYGVGEHEFGLTLIEAETGQEALLRYLEGMTAADARHAQRFEYPLPSAENGKPACVTYGGRVFRAVPRVEH